MSSSQQAVIVAYKRSPFTLALKGKLAMVRPDEMLAQVIKATVNQLALPKEQIEDLIVGCAFPEGEQGLNIARMAVFLSGLPVSAGGVTVNRFCGSSMQAIHQAAGAIAAGSGEVFICAGVESMSRIPMGGFNPAPHPGLFERYPDAYISMGLTAENLAVKYHVAREEQEVFAYQSHQRAIKARDAGNMKDEIVPIVTEAGVIVEDGCIRADTTLEKLAELKPAFDAQGTVTAGTSSPLTDGASVVVVCSEAYANTHGLPKLARIKSMAVSGCDPEIMGIGPVSASRKALARAGLTLADIDIVELNEAFAAQSLSCIKELQLDTEKINIEGGAIALGHPLGASGARITGKAAQLLYRAKKNYALATMCIGGGQGIATILEAV